MDQKNKTNFKVAEIGQEVLRRKAKPVKNIKDFIARIFQHEYDHLEGLVFLDRIKTTKDIISEKEYQRIIKKE